MMREKLETKFKRPVEEVVKELRDEATKAQGELNDASNKLDDHKHETEELKRGVQIAEHHLAQLDNIEEMKMKQVPCSCDRTRPR